MLDQPVDARAVSLGGGEDRAHGVPLVKTRKQDIPILDVHERREQVEPGVPLPDLLPQVRRLVQTAG